MYQRPERQAMYVWLYSMKWKKRLQKYGTVYYDSPKMKYVLIYVNKDKAAEVKNELQKQKFVRRIAMSYRQELDAHFTFNAEEKEEKVD
ncbi:YlbG family protein [Lactobacillus terrae]|uniref:YlbG family protein n=1 Tax=Lactobacillus terrae TaxID=2269374 RepID=UPI000C1B77C7|nr:YlbG family protein [Lactobacillus terrae]